MISGSKRLNELLSAIQYFNTHEWIFQTCNITEMATEVKTLKDSNIVKLDLKDMDWKKYITNYQLGIKKFILKESSESVTSARRSSLYVFEIFSLEKERCMCNYGNILISVHFYSGCTGYIW